MLVFMRFLATMLLALIPLCAQDAPPQQRKGGGGPPKNLKVLTPEQLQAGIMRQFNLALGVQCNYCHVRGDNASDDIPKKIVARSMITMAADINAKFPVAEGKVYVTCFTCHRGKAKPETVAPAPAPGGPQGQ
jgi:photosynthetic reaction center cytochrome c subunit